MHFLFVEENIQIVEVVVAETQRVLALGQQLQGQGGPIAEDQLDVVEEGAVGLGVPSLRLALPVALQLLYLLLGKQIVGEGFLDFGE